MLKQTQSFLENLILLSDFADMQIKKLQLQRKELPNGSVSQRVNGDRRYYCHCTTIKNERIQRYISSDEAAPLIGQIHKLRLLKQSLKCWKKIKSALSSKFNNKCIAMLEEIKMFQESTNTRIQSTLSFFNEEERQFFLEGVGTSFPALQGGEKIRLHNSNDIWLETSDILSKYGVGGIATLEDGIAVRSKSELIILEQLKSSGLEYYYEQGILLNNYTYYPDFLIRHPLSNDFLIWEHCGLMSSDTYFEKWGKKLDVYSRQGIRPCANLILTYEDGDSGFDIKHIRDVIKFYFS